MAHGGLERVSGGPWQCGGSRVPRTLPSDRESGEVNKEKQHETSGSYVITMIVFCVDVVCS